jgi:regulator of protease activity HflC (stomatin/prohibitin superfamily)
MRNIFIIAAASLLITSCAVIRPGEAGVKQRLGKLDS